ENAITKGITPSVVVTALTQTIIALSREKVPIENLSDELMLEIFEALSEGQFSKEALPEVMTAVVNKPRQTLSKTLTDLGLSALSQEKLKRIIEKILDERIEFLKERGIAAHGPLMGILMKEVRGKVDGKLVAQMLKKEIRKRL
ncbi:MAG: GatB/YqeY domain-containing protein, partial [Candidatus Hodarchaeota archaeon]